MRDLPHPPYLLYGSGDRLTDPHDLEDYLFFDLDQSENFLGVRTVMSVPGAISSPPP